MCVWVNLKIDSGFLGASVLAELQSALACAERVYAVLESPEVAESGKEELTSDQVKGAISLIKIFSG